MAKPPPGLQMSPNSSVPLPFGHLVNSIFIKEGRVLTHVGFPPECHRAQRLVRYQVQTSCYEGSRALVTCTSHMVVVSMLATFAGHLRLGDISSQGGTVLSCHLVGVP